MTSKAAADEIQQIIKVQRANESIKNVTEEEKTSLSTVEKEETENVKSKTKVLMDDYAGAIEFLESPIQENFLSDIRVQLKGEFEKSFRSLEKYEFLEREIKKSRGEKIEKTSDKENTDTLKGAVLDKLSTLFLPEFLNRLDDIIVFQPLKQDELRKICDIMIKEVCKRVEPKQIYLTVEDSVKMKLSREGYNPIFGARPLRRLITKYVEDLISENILRTPLTKKGRNIKIILDANDKIVIQS